MDGNCIACILHRGSAIQEFRLYQPLDMFMTFLAQDGIEDGLIRIRMLPQPPCPPFHNFIGKWSRLEEDEACIEDWHALLGDLIQCCIHVSRGPTQQCNFMKHVTSPHDIDVREENRTSSF